MLVVVSSSIAWSSDQASPRVSDLVYVSTSSGGQNSPIYAYRFDATSGHMAFLGIAAQVPSPTFLAVTPNQRFLYAVNAISDYQGRSSGSVSAFSINAKTGKLLLINAQPSGGTGPCYLTLDKSGKNLLVANYKSGTIGVLPLLRNGRLGTITSIIQHVGRGTNLVRQEGPHAHSIETSNDNRMAISADLGLDKLFVYRFDATKGTLTEDPESSISMDPGAGPRHIVFHPNGRLVFVISEMGSTVSVFRYAAGTGHLRQTQTVSTLPLTFRGNNDASELAVSPNGKFLYASNRGHNSIAVFAIDRSTGKLKLISITASQGKTPRHFGIDPTGAFLLVANQESNNIVSFRINRKNGKLTPSGELRQVPFPFCVIFVASHQ
jgi:6-phosphogluconolactonase